MGSAQDGGIPQAGCICANCKNFIRLISSLAIIGEKSAIIIDASPDFRFQYAQLVKRYNVTLKAVYLTHAHWGHYGGLMSFGRESWSNSNLPVFLSQAFYDFLATNQPFAELFSNSNLSANIIEENEETEHKIVPLRVLHRDEFCDSYGYLIKAKSRRVLYLPCLDDFDDKLIDLIRSVDLAIIDGTFYSDDELCHRDISKIPHPRVFLSMERFDDVADHIVFTHLNHSNPLVNPQGEEYLRLISEGFRVAEDWMEL